MCLGARTRGAPAPWIRKPAPFGEGPLASSLVGRSSVACRSRHACQHSSRESSRARLAPPQIWWRPARPSLRKAPRVWTLPSDAAGEKRRCLSRSELADCGSLPCCSWPAARRTRIDTDGTRVLMSAVSKKARDRAHRAPVRERGKRTSPRGWRRRQPDDGRSVRAVQNRV